jgi:hypothetical protein
VPDEKQEQDWSTGGETVKQKALIALAVAGVFAAPVVEARITKVVIESQSIAFGGYSWPGVGQYERLIGTAYGEVSPYNPKNAVIVDIELAKEGDGLVRYSFDFYILKPVDLRRGAHKVMYEPVNRGGKTWAAFGRVPGGNDPGGTITDPAVLANAFLMPRGYALVWSGWDKSAGVNAAKTPASPLTITLPIARVAPTASNPDGTITGPAYEYIVTGGASYTLNYPAASLDKSQAKLTHRVHLDDPPQLVDPSQWAYDATGTAINLVGKNFTNNDIYEFSYTAKNPTVNGLGFAAVRDFVAWLRYARRDDFHNPNPLAGDVKRVYTEVVSQPGRLLNDFRHLGFNQAENGRKVFDGHMQWIAAGDGINMNYRFSQPGRTERNRQDHLFVEGVFPFANVKTYDPISRQADSRYARCQQTGTCPLGVEIYSANEYWVKAASLLHTDPTGSFDLPDSLYTRNYLMSSMQHGTGNAANRGNCQQFQNPLNSAPVQRALFIALDEWATRGTKPPKSRVPTLRHGTLAPPLPQSGVGFPNIPGVTYTGLMTTRYRFDYGLNFYETGIATINPPAITPPYQNNPANGPIYPAYVPRTDRDGNDIAGVRLPDVTVPLATYTGWGLRSGVWANDGCESAGQFIPFAKTEAERVASGDPRPSVEERYKSFRHYHRKVRRALDDMVEERLLLCEDAGTEEARLMQAGLDRGVPPPEGGVLPPVEPLRHCKPGKHRHDDDHDDRD